VYLDLSFPIKGGHVPADHSYLLYAALSHIVRDFHDGHTGVRFSPVTGTKGERGLLDVQPWSRLRVRLPADRITAALSLSGQNIQLGKTHAIQLGTPTIAALVPAPTLGAKVVTFKHSTEPDQFLRQARVRLDELGIAGEPSVPLVEEGPHAGEPRRRIVRIKNQSIVGFALLVTGLSAEESLRLQEEGLGGRCRIGCGFFLPVRPRA
jgi:CRISPR-associated protein Cas6